MSVFYYLVGTKKSHVGSRLGLETVYFSLLRDGVSAKGFIDGSVVFDVSGKVESLPERSLYFSAAPFNWVRPPVEVINGLFNQFHSLAELARLMGLGPSTIQRWKTAGNISFYRWRYLLELLGLSNSVDSSRCVLNVIDF